MPKDLCDKSVFFFFFKQKTAYEIPKREWSSDVCSSDLYTIAPSPLRAMTIWIGTDDGLIHLTKDDGKTWENVTPPALTSGSKVVMIEASHFNVNEAYAAVERHQLSDYAPHIYRTLDSGKTWTEITVGLPAGVYVQTVKEDPHRRGLLFTGTERAVFVAFDDGDHWQSLQLNLPPAMRI